MSLLMLEFFWGIQATPNLVPGPEISFFDSQGFKQDKWHVLCSKLVLFHGGL